MKGKIMRIIIDTNGNKCIKIESSDFNSGRGFSIQTNGNLPFIHKNFSIETKMCNVEKINYNGAKHRILKNSIICVAECEIMDYITEYGTPKQQMKVLGYIPKKG